MKTLIKFSHKLYLYGEARLLNLNQWLLIGSVLVAVIGTSVVINSEKRGCFLEAQATNVLSLNCIVKSLVKQGYYEEAKQIVANERLRGWQQVLNPKQKTEVLIQQQKQILKDSPYLKNALENLVRLNQFLNKTGEMKHYQQLERWIDPLSIN